MSSTELPADPASDDKYAILAVVVALAVIAIGFLYSKMSSKPKTAGALFKDAQISSSLGTSGSNIKASTRIIDLNEHPESDAYKIEKEKIVAKGRNPISEVDNRYLRKLLMRRAIQFLPFAIESQEEFPKIDKQYKSGMYAESEYKKAKQMFDWMNKESEELCEEAEELMPGWGEKPEGGRPPRIFAEAQQVYMELISKVQRGVAGVAPAATSARDGDEDDDDDRADDIVVGK
jgi:hypothetical protein